jgi:hypothetical protein
VVTGEEGMSAQIDWVAGNCPVQAEGYIAGRPFYFRARGSRWSIEIGAHDVTAAPVWEYGERYSDEPYAAGWMSNDEARGFIAAAAARYIAEQSAPETATPGENILGQNAYVKGCYVTYRKE